MVSGVVLAAGESTRMGAPKALLAAPDGQPFVVRISRAFTGAGVDPVVIVTGSAHDRIVEAVGEAALPDAVRLVRNPDPGRGQLSSLWTGMAVAVTPDTQALLVTLVDVPMLSAATVDAVVRRMAADGGADRAPGDRCGARPPGPVRSIALR